MEIKKIKSFDGYPITYRLWATPCPKGSVIYLHGVQSHGGWFVSSCQYLAGQGYQVFAPDRRGSGLNIVGRGDCPSFSALARDVKVFVDLARAGAPDAPVHIVGISWGGKLAVTVALLYPDVLQSIMLVAPGLVQKVDLPAWEKCKVAACRFFSPRALFQIPIERPEMFTSNPERIRYICEDKLMLKQATARFMVESVRMGLFIRRRAGKMAVPVMMMLAETDEIVDNDALVTLFQRFSSAQKMVRVYQGAHHTLEFERDNIPIFQDMAHWLNRCADRQPGNSDPG